MKSVLACGCVLFCVMLSGCGGAAKTNLPGAVFANIAPIYPGATYETSMGGTTSEGIGGPAISESMSWWFKTSDAQDKVTAWYEAQLPNSKKEKGDDGDPKFKIIPPNAEKDEYVIITVRKGEIQITESTKPGKRKKDDLFD